MSNLYAKFVNLLPKRPLLIGTVISNDSGVCRIEMPGGGIESARGAALVGSKVFFRDGNIEANAPTLPIEIIEI